MTILIQLSPIRFTASSVLNNCTTRNTTMHETRRHLNSALTCHILIIFDLSLRMRIRGECHTCLYCLRKKYETSIRHGGTSAVMKLVKLFAESVSVYNHSQMHPCLYLSRRARLLFISKTSSTAAKRCA